MRAWQAHRGAEERFGQRALFSRPLPAPADHAGRADPRGHGAGRRRAGVPHQRHQARREDGLLLCRHRSRALQEAGGARRPAGDRGAPGAHPARYQPLRLRRPRGGPDGRRGDHSLLDAHHRGRMTKKIHPTALVDPGARIGTGESIGPYSVIGPQVEIGEGSWLGNHVVLDGRIRIGRNNRIWHFCSLGAPPQDKKYAGEDTAVEIGDSNTLREYVTINRGTVLDAGVTRLGNDNWIMAYVHFAHDCQIGNKIIFANACQLAGHVTVGDWAIFGATTLVHQFVHVGAHAFTGIGTYLPQDLPPVVTAAGNMARPYGINSEGLKRRGFSPEAIAGLKRAYRTLYRSGLGLEEARLQLSEQVSSCPQVRDILEFLARSKRGIIR